MNLNIGVRAVLTDSLKLLQAGGWCQGHNHQLATGRRCMLGAVTTVYPVMDLEGYTQACEALAFGISQRGETPTDIGDPGFAVHPSDVIVHWNDAYGRTFDDVEDVFKRVLG